MEPIILPAGCCCRCLKYTLLPTTVTVTSSFTQHESYILRCAHGTQTHNVLVSTRIPALNANLVVGQPEDCSVFCSMLCVVSTRSCSYQYCSLQHAVYDSDARKSSVVLQDIGTEQSAVRTEDSHHHITNDEDANDEVVNNGDGYETAAAATPSSPSAEDGHHHDADENENRNDTTANSS